MRRVAAVFRTHLWLRRFGAASAVILIVLLFIFFSYRLLWRGKIFPGISVSGIAIGGLSPERANDILSRRSAEFLESPLSLSYDEQGWTIEPSQLSLSYEPSVSVRAAYLSGRNGGFFGLPPLLGILEEGKDLPLRYTLDEQVLESSISAIASAVNVPSIPPSLEVLAAPDPQTHSRIKVEAGEAGLQLDVSSLRRTLHERFFTLSQEPVVLHAISLNSSDAAIDPVLTTMRAERLLDRTVVLSYAENSHEALRWELTGEEIVHFLSFDGGFDTEKIASYSATLAESIDRQPVNATFAFRDGRVVEFSPEQNGLTLNTSGTTDALTRTFSELEMSEETEMTLSLPVSVTLAQISTSEVNNLGIRELLGRGVTTFHGSIANREHNIALAASRVNGVLIAPGEVFSFNATVGDISAATGYRQAYIIKEGRTILDDGGGVCQVSTTLFRSALESGLPITERTAHSYRVSYYEQNSKPGFDATVFAPRVDLKILNDTPGHLLIQTETDTAANTLVFEIYGTSDGRVPSITNHRVWDVSPPPPDLYQDDPTLPAGSVKQVDWKAWGAKVKFDYSVSRDGATIYEKTFYSNFRPWQSVFLRGTGSI